MSKKVSIIRRIQSWLFYKIFGVRKETLIDLKLQHLAVKETQASILADLTIIKDSLAEVYQMTGGTGWTDTMQQAMAHLDSRIDELHEAIIYHQQLFTQLTQENEEGFLIIDNSYRELN